MNTTEQNEANMLIARSPPFDEAVARTVVLTTLLKSEAPPAILWGLAVITAPLA
jgi:hypothetical protein